MEIQNFAKIYNLRKSLSVASGTQIMPLFNPSQAVRDLGLDTSSGQLITNAFVKALKVYVKIRSLPEIELPNIQLTDSSTEKLIKFRNQEWDSARIQLNLLIGAAPNWTVIGAISLLHRKPAYAVDLLNFFTDALAIECDGASCLALQIEDVGWGLLTAQDTVTAYGSLAEEVTYLAGLEPVIEDTQSYGWSVGTTSRVLLPANANRKQFTLVNTGERVVYLSYGRSAVVGQGIALLAEGGSYEHNKNNFKLTDAIHAISDTPGSTVTGIECV